MTRRTVFNAKKRVEHFMREKSDFIEEKTGIELYYESDYEDMKGYHKKALIGLKDYDSIHDYSACPQCIVFLRNTGCTFCPYSTKHGQCANNRHLDNTYGQIIDRLPMGKQSITDAVSSEVMESFIRWL